MTDTEEVLNAPAPTPKKRGRPPSKNKVRQSVAEETPRQAANPVREPQRERKKGGDDIDHLYVDPSRIPPHMDYNWKRLTYAGKEDTRHQIRVAQYGAWTAVPRSRHPEIVGYNPKDPTEAIVVDGLMLMERPKRLSEEAKAEDLMRARAQVNNQLQSLKLTDQGQLPRKVNTLKKGYDLSIPEDDSTSNIG